MIQRAFFLKEPWLSLVLSGKKIYELRTKRTNILNEEVGIIRQGSGTLVGICSITACHGPLSHNDLQASFSKHRTTGEDRYRLFGQRDPFAWELFGVTKLAKPVPYTHINGSQGWHTISPEVAQQVAHQGRS